jgi:hypothetical protein
MSFRKLYRSWFLFLLLCCVSPTLGWTQSPATDDPAPVHTGRTPEDWTSLSLDGSKLTPAVPVFGEKADFPTFTRELWQVKWRTGDPIDLYVIRPKGIAKPPAILYLYSFPSDTNRFRNNDWCERVTGGGFAAVGFVSALTGQRYAMRPMKEWFISEMQESLGSSVHDVQMILNALSARGDLDVSQVGMFATGSGASIAILAAAADPRIKAIDLLDPWGDWPDWMAKSSIIPENERPNFVKPEFLKKIEPLEPVQWLPKLKAQVRIQRLLDDKTTPDVAEEKIEAAAGPSVSVVRYKNVMQLYGSGSDGRLFQWVKDQIRPASQAAKSSEGAGAQPATQDGRKN